MVTINLLNIYFILELYCYDTHLLLFCNYCVFFVCHFLDLVMVDSLFAS
jgi:hypothetical protein